MKKISEWLRQFDGHSALDVAMARESFEKETGKEWPDGLTGEPVARALRAGKKDFKGLQSWDGKPDAHIAGGWVVASRLASKYVPNYKGAYSIGRGSAFAEHIDALRKVGQ